MFDYSIMANYKQYRIYTGLYGVIFSLFLCSKNAQLQSAVNAYHVLFDRSVIC